ncbi:MAG: hypothetical protein ACFFCV_18675 [Promethearchaeota archaeon]
MTKYHEIFKEILKEITPTQREIEFIKIIGNKLTKLLDNKAKELNLNYTKIEPQGSTGIKQTQLRNDFDIDLFVGLDYELYKSKYKGMSKSKLKKESKKDFLSLCNKWILPSLMEVEFHNPRLLYAEHPYVTVEYVSNHTKIKIDIVLYFNLDSKYINKNGPITAVDRSPWHGYFVRDKLNQTQKNEVRILKQFFKSCYSYGDKSPVGKVGFIGYSAELLIYYFENLYNLFKNFNKLNSISLDFFNRTEKELKKIPHFQNDHLIIIDPIDKNRNVASAISERAYRYCNYKISEFLKKPSIEFFKIEPIPEIDLSNKSDVDLSHTYIVEMQNNDKDIHYTINRDKLYSLGESLIVNGEKEFSHAERFGNIICDVYFEDEKDQYNLTFYCEKPHISKTYDRRGPPTGEKNHVINFKRKNPGFFEKNGYLWVRTSREYTDFIDYLNIFIQDKIPDNFAITNISIAFDTVNSSGKKAIYILQNMILPFCT